MEQTRSCNGCSECCTTHRVNAIDKPKQTRCGHCLEGGGCAIYGKHPTDCADYFCAYRLGMRGAHTWPKGCGFVQEERNYRLLGLVWVMTESREGALKTKEALEEIRWAAGEGYIVKIETIDGVQTFIIPKGMRIKLLARMIYEQDLKIPFVFDYAFFEEAAAA